MFYMEDYLTVKTGEEIFGTIGMRPNAKNNVRRGRRGWGGGTCTCQWLSGSVCRSFIEHRPEVGFWGPSHGEAEPLPSWCSCSKHETPWRGARGGAPRLPGLLAGQSCPQCSQWQGDGLGSPVEGSGLSQTYRASANEADGAQVAWMKMGP